MACSSTNKYAPKITKSYIDASPIVDTEPAGYAPSSPSPFHKSHTHPQIIHSPPSHLHRRRSQQVRPTPPSSQSHPTYHNPQTPPHHQTKLQRLQQEIQPQARTEEAQARSRRIRRGEVRYLPPTLPLSQLTNTPPTASQTKNHAPRSQPPKAPSSSTSSTSPHQEKTACLC